MLKTIGKTERDFLVWRFNVFLHISVYEAALMGFVKKINYYLQTLNVVATSKNYLLQGLIIAQIIFINNNRMCESVYVFVRLSLRFQKRSVKQEIYHTHHKNPVFCYPRHHTIFDDNHLLEIVYYIRSRGLCTSQ